MWRAQPTGSADDVAEALGGVKKFEPCRAARVLVGGPAARAPVLLVVLVGEDHVDAVEEPLRRERSDARQRQRFESECACEREGWQGVDGGVEGCGDGCVQGCEWGCDKGMCRGCERRCE